MNQLPIYPERPRMQKIVPPGERPTAKVIHFELKDDVCLMLDNLRYLRDGSSFMVARPGHYVKLVADGHFEPLPSHWDSPVDTIVEQPDKPLEPPRLNPGGTQPA